VARVAGLSRQSAPVRRIATAESGQIEIPVEVDTHVTSILEFSSGVVGTFIGSFDVWSHRLPAIEVYGSMGTLSLPHPNWYDGTVEVKLHDDIGWREVKPVFDAIQADPLEKVRGLGVVDLVQAGQGRSHRTNSQIALHVLEVLEAMQSSSESRSYIDITSQPPRPDPLSQSEVEGWRARPPSQQ
jgi:predicted dehydrogenase